MSLSREAEKYYRELLSVRTNDIETWFLPEMNRAKGRSLEGGIKNQGIANVLIERWERLVNARVDCLVMAYRTYDELIEEADIKDFFRSLMSGIDSVQASFRVHAQVSGISKHIPRKLEPINRLARTKLHVALRDLELGQTKDGGRGEAMYPDKIYTKENTYQSEIMRHGVEVEVENSPETDPGRCYKTQALRVGEGVFKFTLRDEITNGANIRVENGRDIWRVVDVMDEMSRYDGIVGHKVFVQRIGKDGGLIDHRGEARMAFYGPTAIGVMQTGGTGNIASGSATVNVDLQQNINKLKEAFSRSDEIEEIDKEVVREALDKIVSLAGREQNRSVLEWIKKYVGTISEIAIKGQQLFTVAGPLIDRIHQHWPNITW